MPGAATTLGTADSRLWLLGPSRSLKQLLTKWKDLKLELGVFGAGTLTVTIHQSHVDASDSGDDCIATDFGWTGTQGLWSLDYYHRGTLVFSGPVQTVVKSRDGGTGTAYVTVVAETWGPALLRRRVVRTSTGAPFTVTNDTWHDIACKLMREQCDPDDVVTPTGWQQAAEVRSDFGAFTVQVAADSGAGTADYQCEVRTNLWDALCELCNTPTSTDDRLWPTWSESPAGTFTFDVLVGRSGGSRGIGADKTASVYFSSLHGTLTRFELTRDGAATENHIVCGGDGPGAGQRTRHAAYGTSITTRNLGVMEGVEELPGGITDGDLDNILNWALADRSDVRTWTAEITESASQYWPTHFDVKDSVAVYDEAFGETVSAMIIGVSLTYPAPGPYTLSLTFGQHPRNEIRSIGRAGGGGGGGRGGGGRARNKDGIRYVYDHIDGNSGTSTAHQCKTGLDLIGELGTMLRPYVTMTDETVGDTDDEAEIKIWADFFAADPTATGCIKVRNSAGGYIWLIATDQDPGGT